MPAQHRLVDDTDPSFGLRDGPAIAQPVNVSKLPRSLVLLSAALIAGCTAQSQAEPQTAITASSSPEAELCATVATHIGTLHGTASADDFRTFSAQIANDLGQVKSTVGVDLAIANSYATLLGIHVSEYRDPNQRLRTAVDFVDALQTYVTSCTRLGVAMPDGWQPTDAQSDPRALGGRSARRA